MKKLMILTACTMLAAVTHAAAVGWQLAGAQSYANDAYQFFVIGQNGTDSIATITALLDAGTATDSYAFGSGKVAANEMPQLPQMPRENHWMLALIQHST